VSIFAYKLNYTQTHRRTDAIEHITSADRRLATNCKMLAAATQIRAIKQLSSSLCSPLYSYFNRTEHGICHQCDHV